MEKQTKQDKPIYLLDSFIHKRLRDYKEPSRAGTPRGEPIGHSFKKYSAGLLCLKKIPLKEIAKATNVSHGLLRKWRTEDNFKELMEELIKEFLAELINHLIRRGIKQAELADEYFERPVKEICEIPPPELTWTEFEDLKFYSKQLIVNVAIIVPKHFKALFEEAKEHFPFVIEGPKLPIQKQSVIYQVTHFFELLRLFPFNKRAMKKGIELFDSQKKSNKDFHSKAVLISISHEWNVEGVLSEFTLKRTIYAIHQSIENFTPVDMDI